MTIEQEVKSLRRGMRALALLWLVTIGAIATIAARSKPAEIVAKRIAVIDAKGVERVVIAAPLPDPVVAGKRLKRSGVVSGIAIFDAAGNERGGYVTNDDAAANGAFITLDASDGQVFMAYANAARKDGATVSLTNGKGDDATMTTWGQPMIQFSQGRNIVFKQPPNAPDLQ